MMRRLQPWIFLAALCLWRSPALADDFVVDQKAEPYRGFAFNPVFYTRSGQEFVPQLSSLDVVELQASVNAGEPAVLRVRILKDSIRGPVVATSHDAVVTIEPLPPEYYSNGQLSRFDFSPSVPLVPGNLYVIQLFVVPADLPVNAGVFGGNHDVYPAGRLIFEGEPSPDADLWFREGILVATPTETTTWGRIKAKYAIP